MSVYFITARKAGRVKIGCAHDAWERLAKIQSTSPLALSLEAVIPGTYDEERKLHLRFAAHRLHGEWFALCPEIEQMIADAGSPVRPEGQSRKRKRDDNAQIETRSRQYERELEELVEKSLRAERETYAEYERWCAKHDPDRQLPDLELTTRRNAA